MTVIYRNPEPDWGISPTPARGRIPRTGGIAQEFTAIRKRYTEGFRREI